MTTEQYIERCITVHGNKYDYTQTEYHDMKSKVHIICPLHGEFHQRADAHLNGSGCPKCKGRNKTTNDFIKAAREAHNDKYDYSKAEYINASAKVCIICPVHGKFWQTPHHHLNGQGCPECGRAKTISSTRYTTDEFIEQSNAIHNNKYDYSKTEYYNNYTKIVIRCPIHGEFKQQPRFHLKGNGCPLCAKDASRLPQEEFVNRAASVHNNKYDYSKINYVNNKDKICIICPKHGEFWQVPINHLHGKGCPKCNQSKLEKEVEDFLRENNIVFEQQKKFEWLKNKQPLSLDFYLPDYNIAIECQGEQHFHEMFNDTDKFQDNLLRDKLKFKLCQDNGIEVLYYTKSSFFNKNVNSIYNQNNVNYNVNSLMNQFFLRKTINEFYKEGVTDENLVMEVVKANLGGNVRKATKKEDLYKHIDFWWDSPKKGMMGIDVKGIKRNARADKQKNDSINWVELQGVAGYPGWIYGEAEYIAFRTYTDIIFVKREVLKNFAEEATKDKEVVYKLPSECYIPYQRYGRQDKVFKVLTEDLRRLSENNGFILKYTDDSKG